MTYLCGEVVEEIAEVLKRFNKIKKLDRLLEAYWKNEVME